MKIRALIPAVAALLVLAGCGGDADVAPAGADDSTAVVVDQESESAEPAPVETTEAEPVLPDEDALEAFFGAVAQNTLESLGEASNLALEGSPAAAYVTYLRELEQASVDGGQPTQDSEPAVEQIDGGYKFCEASDSSICYEYTELTGDDGKISNFTVNESPIKHRLTLGNGKSLPVQATGGESAFLAAFKTTSSDRLLVVVNVKSPASQSLNMSGATYRSPEGRQSESELFLGPSELSADSLANYAFSFPGAAIGGEVTLNLFSDDFMTEGSVTFKTK